MDWTRRFGRVSISIDAPVPLVKQVHEMLFIIEKDYSFYHKTSNLIAAHDSFREISPGEEVPEYRVIVTKLDHIHMQGLFIYFEEITQMNVRFIGTVTEKELRLMFDLTADSTPETETPEEKDKRFDSILLDWHQEVTKV